MLVGMYLGSIVYSTSSVVFLVGNIEKTAKKMGYVHSDKKISISDAMPIINKFILINTLPIVNLLFSTVTYLKSDELLKEVIYDMIRDGKLVKDDNNKFNYQEPKYENNYEMNKYMNENLFNTYDKPKVLKKVK